MKLISFMSFKGGSGKTTALMAVTSALIAKGYRIALLEADDNHPLSAWRENARQKGNWSDDCEVMDAANMEALEASFEAASENGFDFAIADTRGGASELNNVVVANSDMVVIPTQLTAMDVDEMCATYAYVVEVLAAEGKGETVATGILKQRVATSMTVNQKLSDDTIAQLPQFPTPFKERDAFASQKLLGLMHMTHKQLLETPSKRIQANNYAIAIKEAVQVTEDLLDELGIGDTNMGETTKELKHGAA